MSKPRLKRLGDVVNFKRGYDLPASARRAGPYPVLSSAGVSGFHDEYKKEGEGLVTGRYGTLGEVHYISGRYWPHNTALYVTDFKGNYPKYVYFLMKSRGNLQTADKSAVPGINRNDLHEVMVPCHQPADQKPIADLLWSIEEMIALNTRINAELEAMAKLLYDYWFVQFDFPNAKGKPYKSSGGAMVYNAELKREVPEGWEVGTLLDIANYANGLACQRFRPTGEEHLRVIKIKEMGAGFTPDSEKTRPDIPAKALVENGDVLFSWSASLEVMIWAGGKGALNQHIFKVTSQKYPKSFFFHQLRNYLQHFKMMAENRKTTMGHITQEHLEQSRIVIPPLDLIKQLDEKIAPLMQLQVTNSIQNQELTTLRDWLLPMLMNGQVVVGEAEEKVGLAMAAEPGGKYGRVKPPRS